MYLVAINRAVFFHVLWPTPRQRSTAKDVPASNQLPKSDKRVWVNVFHRKVFNSFCGRERSELIRYRSFIWWIPCAPNWPHNEPQIKVIKEENNGKQPRLLSDSFPQSQQSTERDGLQSQLQIIYFSKFRFFSSSSSVSWWSRRSGFGDDDAFLGGGADVGHWGVGREGWSRRAVAGSSVGEREEVPVGGGAGRGEGTGEGRDAGGGGNRGGEGDGHEAQALPLQVLHRRAHVFLQQLRHLLLRRCQAVPVLHLLIKKTI